jgi:hypothetical protein
MHKRETVTRWCLLIAMLMVFLIGLFLRLESGVDTVVVGPLRADAGNYFAYAYNLRHFGVYSMENKTSMDLASTVNPDALRPPGYPLLLTLFMDNSNIEKVLGKIVVAQVLLSALTVVLSFLFFRRLVPASWSVAACMLVALCPHLIVYNSFLLTETLFCFTMVLFAILVAGQISPQSRWSALLVGGVLGVASLVRPGIQYFCLILPLFYLFQYGRRKGLQFSGIFLLGFTIVVSPWFIRNLSVLHKTSDNTLMIGFLHHGIYPNFTFEGQPRSFGYPYRYDPRSSEISRSVSSVLEEIARRFHDDPLRHLKWYVLEKPVCFWSWESGQEYRDCFIYPVSSSPYFTVSYFRWTHHLMKVIHWPLVVLSLVGSVLVWIPAVAGSISERRIFAARFASLIILYFTSIHMIGVPDARYSIPLRPFTYGMGLFTLYYLITRILPAPSHPDSLDHSKG